LEADLPPKEHVGAFLRPFCYAFRKGHLHLPQGREQGCSGRHENRKTLLLVTTPLGMITGLIEAYRMVGGPIVLVLAGIVASLGKALFHMSSGGSDDPAIAPHSVG
jgi:hypothetical protein